MFEKFAEDVARRYQEKLAVNWTKLKKKTGKNPSLSMLTRQREISAQKDPLDKEIYKKTQLPNGIEVPYTHYNYKGYTPDEEWYDKEKLLASIDPDNPELSRLRRFVIEGKNTGRGQPAKSGWQSELDWDKRSANEKSYKGIMRNPEGRAMLDTYLAAADESTNNLIRGAIRKYHNKLPLTEEEYKQLANLNNMQDTFSNLPEGDIGNVLPGLKIQQDVHLPIEDVKKSVSDRPHSDVFSRRDIKPAAVGLYQRGLRPAAYFSPPNVIDGNDIGYGGKYLTVLGKERSKQTMNPMEWRDNFVTTPHLETRFGDEDILSTVPSSKGYEAIVKGNELKKAFDAGNALTFADNFDGTFSPATLDTTSNLIDAGGDIRRLGMQAGGSKDGRGHFIDKPDYDRYLSSEKNTPGDATERLINSIIRNSNLFRPKVENYNPSMSFLSSQELQTPWNRFFDPPIQKPVPPQPTVTEVPQLNPQVREALRSMKLPVDPELLQYFQQPAALPAPASYPMLPPPEESLPKRWFNKVRNWLGW